MRLTPLRNAATPRNAAPLRNAAVHRIAALVALSILFPAEGSGEDLVDIASLEVPGSGRVEVLYPQAWQRAIIQPSPELPPTLKLRSDSGPRVSLQITFLPDPERILASRAAVEEAVRQIGERYAPTSIEQQTVVQVAETRSGLVGVARFSDRAYANAAVPPGEYKTATVGIVSIGDVAGTVTLLSDDFTSDNYKIALTTVVSGILNE